MDAMKATAAAHRHDAALHLGNAARLHREAARQCEFGNPEKARDLATEAAETGTAAHRHAMQALDLNRHHAEQVAARKAGAAAEDAAGPRKRPRKPSYHRPV